MGFIKKHSNGEMEVMASDDVLKVFHDEKILVAEAWKECGGSFLQALGDALLRADDHNAMMIKLSFPHYWQQYKTLARARKVTP